MAGEALFNAEDDLKQIFDGSDDVLAKLYGWQPADGQSRSNTIYGRLALDDYVSHRLVSGATGDVQVWAPNGLFNKVFADAEFSALLSNPNATSVNGILKSELIDSYNSHPGGGGGGVKFGESTPNQAALNGLIVIRGVVGVGILRSRGVMGRHSWSDFGSRGRSRGGVRGGR